MHITYGIPDSWMSIWSFFVAEFFGLHVRV